MYPPRILAITIICLYSFNTKSQTPYHPFPTGYAFWAVEISNSPCCFHDYYLVNGDTIIDGLNYSKLFWSRNDTGYYPYLKYFLREDSFKNIYIESSLSPNFFPYRCFDFKLGLNDTFKYYNNYKLFDSIPIMVYQVDTIQTLVDSRRRLKIKSANPALPLWGYQETVSYWIEGIGSNLGFDAYLNAPFEVPDELPYYQLICFWENGQYVLESLKGCFFTGIGEIEKEKFVFSVSPNPTSDKIQIISPAFISKNLTITISDMLGHIIKRVQSNHSLSQNILISDIASGYYLTTVFDKDENRIFSTGLIKK